MSKVDAQRAMREARYAARSNRGASAMPATAPPPLAAPVPRAASPVVPPAPPAAEPHRQPATSTPATAEDHVGVCGHRNMSNKSCQRPAGHPEKSHRYR